MRNSLKRGRGSGNEPWDADSRWPDPWPETLVFAGGNELIPIPDAHVSLQPSATATADYYFRATPPPPRPVAGAEWSCVATMELRFLI